MATCRGCGAEITHAQTAEGEHVPLEQWSTTDGKRRFRVVEFGPPLIVEPVSPTSPVSAQPDHRADCPAYDNGL